MPLAPDPDISGVLSRMREKLKSWALELRDGRTEEELGVGEGRKGILIPL